MGNFEHTCIPQVKDGLSEVFGSDLAESLVTAAMSNDQSAMSKQILISDGLSLITDEQREKALELLDIYTTTLA